MRKNFRPLVWPNLVCLDAPLVAVSWQWLCARTFEIPMTRGSSSALFLTAWLIYLADRFGDSRSLDPRGPASLRQRFCLRHRRAWLGVILVITVMDAVIIFTRIERETMAAGASVGVLAFGYLIVNRRWPTAWRILPLKETVVGFLFAAGTVVGLAPALARISLPVWLLFAGLCSLNCISIAVWERVLDQAQGRISIATVFPGIERSLLLALGLVAVLGWMRGSEAGLAIGLSAVLLAGVHILRARIATDLRTALADLALLTPPGLLLSLAF